METRSQPTMKDTQRYDSLPRIDEHSDDSSTEVGDWDLEHAPHQSRRRKTRWQRVKSHRWILDTSLLLIILGLLLEKRHHYHKPPTFDLLGDLTGFTPSFFQQIVKFTPDPVFAPEDASAFFSNETQEAWLAIVPAGLGYVEVQNKSLYSNLPSPIHDYPSKHVYTTSVTHQLHCLYTIVAAYNTQKLALASPSNSEPVIKMPWHINHCFEYLRQAVMCAGDVALEGAATTFPEGELGDRGGSDGWDAKHVCRDYGEVKEYLERVAVNDYHWIGSE